MKLLKKGTACAPRSRESFGGSFKAFGYSELVHEVCRKDSLWLPVGFVYT